MQEQYTIIGILLKNSKVRYRGQQMSLLGEAFQRVCHSQLLEDQHEAGNKRSRHEINASYHVYSGGCHHLLARLTQQRSQSASVQENCAVGENSSFHYIISEIEQ